MTRRSYSGNAPQTSLADQVSAGGTQLTLADATGYPTGVSGPFFLALDIGKSTEEKVLCSSRTADIVTVASRGADGTTASSHPAGATVSHVWTATDADESNAHVNATGDVHGVTGDLEVAIEGIAAWASGDAIATHEAAADPHPQYLTQPEGDAQFLTQAEGDALFTTPAENDARYLKLTGGALTGAVTTTGNFTTTADVLLAAGAPLVAESAVPKRYVDALSSVPSGFRNVIRNGDMSIAQRGNGPFTTTASCIDGYVLDTVGGSVSLNRTTPVPGLSSTLRLAVSGQQPGHHTTVSAWIEDVATLADQPFVLSFVAYAVDGPSPVVGLRWSQVFGAGGSPYVALDFATVTLTPVRKRYTVTGTFPPIADKTVGAGSRLQINFAFSGESGVPLQSNTFYLTDVQLEAGSVATAFERLPVQQQLAWCQRYFQRIGTSNPNVAWPSANGRFAMGYFTSGSGARAWMPFYAPMRTAPTASLTPASSFTVQAPGTVGVSNIYLFETSAMGVAMDIVTTSATGIGLGLHLMQDSSDTCYFDLSAEL